MFSFLKNFGANKTNEENFDKQINEAYKKLKSSTILIQYRKKEKNTLKLL